MCEPESALQWIVHVVVVFQENEQLFFNWIYFNKSTWTKVNLMQETVQVKGGCMFESISKWIETYYTLSWALYIQAYYM